MKNTYTDKVVWITGTSSGIGKETAFRFAEAGARLILTALEPDLLEQVCEECLRLGAKAVTCLPFDLGQTDALPQLAQDALNAYGRIDAEAAASPVGANGVMFHPYLQGERCPYWDADLRASFTGVSIASTRGDFARALMEGVAFSLRDCYRTLEEMALPVKRIFLIGGGARSALWSEIVCNVFDRPVAVPSPGDASFGAALLAGVGIGVFRDAKDAVARCLCIDRRLEPDPATAATYADLFARYRAIHDALAPIYARG